MESQHSFLAFTERLNPRRKLLLYILLLSIGFALYGTTLYYQFVWDDYLYIFENYRVLGLSYPQIRAIWTGTYLGHYAPIHHMFLAILYHFSGMEPYGYHLGQLLVHAACVCLLYFILNKLESARVAFLAALLFVVHPTNIETIAWISETKSTLAFLFFLLSFWTFLRYREKERPADLVLSCLFLVFSMLAKINTVVAPAIFFLYDYAQDRWFERKKISSMACLFLISGLFVIVHMKASYGLENSMESSYYGGLGVHILNLPFLLLFYLQMAIVPHGFSAWHMFRVYDHFDVRVVAAWIGLLGLAWMVYRSDRRTQFWALWFVVFLAPVLQIVPFPIWVAERYLYIPAIGLFVLGSRLFFWIGDRLRAPVMRLGWEGIMGAALLVFAWQTHAHLPIWENDLVLWGATVKTCETSAYCHINYGLALLQTGSTERGVKELIRAVELHPSPKFLERLGDAYTLSLADYRQALIAYNMAVTAGGRSTGADVYAKLARAYIKSGNFDFAQRAIDSGSQVDPNEPKLLVANGFLQWKRGNLQLALDSLRKALRVTGRTSNPSAFIDHFWGDPAEVGRLIGDLKSMQSSGSSTLHRTYPQKKEGG